MTPSPRLLQSLQRSRLLVRSAKATVGIGERRSDAKGSGMEFLDFREYQPGDDVRHLDPHLFARTGAHYVSIGALTHSAPAADLSFELERDDRVAPGSSTEALA